VRFPGAFAGAGAAAARSEVAGFFRVELLRRAVMELLLPCMAYEPLAGMRPILATVHCPGALQVLVLQLPGQEWLALSGWSCHRP
jgi:hypothetical protein